MMDSIQVVLSKGAVVVRGSRGLHRNPIAGHDVIFGATASSHVHKKRPTFDPVAKLAGLVRFVVRPLRPACKIVIEDLPTEGRRLGKKKEGWTIE